MADPTGRISHTDDFHRGQSWKKAVRVASTANITLVNALENGDSLDGITLATGDRVLLKDQTAGAENGIYIVNASGAPTRAPDMDQDTTTSVPAEEVMGALVLVIAGTTNGGTLWRCTNTTAPTLGTTSLVFAQIAAAAALTIKDEGIALATAGTSIDFVGLGVVASGSGAAKTVTISGEDKSYQDNGSTGATETVDCSIARVHHLRLDANCTITLTGSSADEAHRVRLLLQQDGTGSRTVTWPASVIWPAGAAPTLSTGANRTDIVDLITINNGTEWLGVLEAADYHTAATGARFWPMLALTSS